MKWILIVLYGMFSVNCAGQDLSSDNKSIEKAFELAMRIVDENTRSGILAAGADYGGEWTRDIAINSWNGVSLLRSPVAEASLWSVTGSRDSIGHQYWDKIIWVVAAYNHYKITGNLEFLKQAYRCAANSILSLEQYAYDKQDGLFTGPSVFNDGIAGYPEPIFQPGNYSSFVLDHRGADRIKCLSTNSVYYGAYSSIVKMAKALQEPAVTVNSYVKKAERLKKNIITHLYDSKRHRFQYLVDQNGRVNSSQEALGISLATLFGVVSGNEGNKVISRAVVSRYGITSIYPDFSRYSPGKPGRHNNIVWPMVNGFFAGAARATGNYSIFANELRTLTHLALDSDKGNNDFKEIYNPYDGRPDGGWQGNGAVADYHWKSCDAQTWSATAYLGMVLNGLFGLKFEEQALSVSPFLPADIHHIAISDLKYRNAILNIEVRGSGRRINSFIVDGKVQQKNSIAGNIQGVHQVVIILKQ